MKKVQKKKLPPNAGRPNPRAKLLGNRTRVKPELPGGFRDYGPEQAILRQRLLGKIRKTFEDFGFDPMETPAVERTEVLTGGEKDSDKIIFNVKGSQDKSFSKAQDKQSSISLRFDLTVPLARFVAANPDIPKPFKRYQIGNVWRGESPQAGRYREFLQADIDVVGSSSMDADAEVIMVMNCVFKNLGLSDVRVRLNNRKILNGLPFFAGFPEKKLWDLLRIIDKKDKIGKDAVEKEMRKMFSPKISEKIMEFLAISGDAKTKLLAARELLKGNMEAGEGVKELAEIIRTLRASGVRDDTWEIDFSMVRGLGYYTGPVFEAILTGAPDLGSIAGGGRYDGLLIPFTGQKIPAVGVSFGVDRLLAILEKMGLLKKRGTVTKVLIVNLDPDLKEEYLSLASVLRANNINTVYYIGDDRAFQAQLAYAVKKEIPYVLLYGKNEKAKGIYTVKNLVTREQKEIQKENLLQYFKK